MSRPRDLPLDEESKDSSPSLGMTAAVSPLPVSRLPSPADYGSVAFPVGRSNRLPAGSTWTWMFAAPNVVPVGVSEERRAS